MTKRWLIVFFVAALFGDKAFADCVPSPDTPASVIEYFQKFNKPLPERFCAKELEAKKAAFTLATNDLAQATRNLSGVLERCAKGE